MKWFFAVLNKYAVFEGRAHRTEYWMFTLFYFIIWFVLAILAAILGAVINETLSLIVLGILAIFLFATIIPVLAVSVRRLHDTGRSGWWFLINFVPIVSLVFLVFTLLESTPGDNEYGPPPSYDV
jgi:uncharacterized membrane protein YhaH (DUF805 family)